MVRCSLLLLLAATPAAAADPGPWQRLIGNPDWLQVTGTARARVETLAGGIRPGVAREETLVMTRGTALVDVGDGPVHLVTEIWDSRAFNIEPGSFVGNGEVNTLEPVQAHLRVDLGKPFGPASHAAVSLGRMVINLGSRRLIAADDYRNTTNGYTGIRVDLAPAKNIEATLIYTLPQQRLPDDPTRVRERGFELDRENFAVRLWGGIALWKHAVGDINLELSGFRFEERDTPQLATRDRHLSTIDARLFRSHALGQWDVELEGAWQWGSSRTGLSNALPLNQARAWYVHGDVGYSFRSAWKPRLSVEFDAISGDRPGGAYTRFDTLFGMRRADFSPGSLLSYIGRANMVAPALRLEVEPSARTDGFATVRPMWAESGTDIFSQTGVRDASGRSGRFAGWELDSRIRHWLVRKRLRGELNTVVIVRDRLLKAPGTPPGNTVTYFSATLFASF